MATPVLPGRERAANLGCKPALTDCKACSFPPSPGLEGSWAVGTREVGVILHKEAYASHEALLGLLLPNLISKCQELVLAQAQCL